ncbi:MAG: MBL fold metallo-hydrolase, partial [Planctomycetes bacterium]|nr:MBL fold metallo-hydrolase [Planctomycetota bacterium]
HRDHIRGATDFCRRNKARVFAVRRTARALGTECHKRITRVVPERWFEPADGVRVLPVPVPHDAPDTVALLVEAGSTRYGHATDLGAPEGTIRELLTDCDVLYLEFNYDSELLASGDYPPMLKRRIASDRGHLGNHQASELLATLAGPRLRHVFVAHVSQANNTADLAVGAARRALTAWPDVEIELARQERPTATFTAQETNTR